MTKLQRAVDLRNGVELNVLPPGFTYRIDGDKIVDVESNDREFSYDVLFEQDGDQLSLSTMILDSILQVRNFNLTCQSMYTHVFNFLHCNNEGLLYQCSVDMRRPLAENILLIGGTAMAKGLKARLQEELLSLLKEEKYSKKLFVNKFKFHSPPALPNYVSWLGGIS